MWEDLQLSLEGNELSWLWDDKVCENVGLLTFESLLGMMENSQSWIFFFAVVCQRLKCDLRSHELQSVLESKSHSTLSNLCKEKMKKWSVKMKIRFLQALTHLLTLKPPEKMWKNEKNGNSTSLAVSPEGKLMINISLAYTHSTIDSSSRNDVDVI